MSIPEGMAGGEGGADAVEARDSLSMPAAATGGRRIDFAWDASTGFDGVDFAVDHEPVYFSIYLDGALDETAVFFSSADSDGVTSTSAGMPLTRFAWRDHPSSREAMAVESADTRGPSRPPMTPTMSSRRAP